MRRTARSVWFVSCILLLTAMALPQPATAQDANKTPEKNITHFKDWAVICPEPDNKDVPSCEAILRVTVSETGQQILRVSIFKVPESEHPLGVVILPLGFLLPQGAVLSVDGKEIGRLPVQRCEPVGCLAPLIVNDELQSFFKAGKAAEFKITNIQGQTVALPMSLSGFTAALAALDKP